MKNEIVQKHDRVTKLIPNTLQDITRAADIGSSRAILNEHSINWLMANGKCLDNIRAGVSTIPAAGRGAFASRFIPKGSIVSPAPLVQIMNKDAFKLDMYGPGYERSQQLLLNYCFGHKHSSLLLCPTTAVSLINHSGDNKNAEYKWSDSSANKVNDKHFLMESLEQLHSDPQKLFELNSKLMFDFIATRDIEAGEEIFIDYGVEWENAWKEHTEQWEKPYGADTFIPANVMNSEKWDILLSDDPALLHHSYLCQLEPFSPEEYAENIPEEDYNANPHIEQESWPEEHRVMYADHDFLWWWPCDVVESNPENTIFRTVVYSKIEQDSHDPAVIRRFQNVPRHAIKFVNKRYHSDQHVHNAFRHYIPIDDGIFPLHWRNDYVRAEDIRLGTKNEGIDFYNMDHQQVAYDYEKTVREAKCGVYVATSTIPNAGKGIYMGVTVPGKDFTSISQYPVLPVVDFPAGVAWDARDYVWFGNTYETEYEAGSQGHVDVMVVNHGALANFHPGLVNFHPGKTFFSPLLDLRIDPGAGAFSDYADFSFLSQHEVKAGEEVFISYGESWFSAREGLKHNPFSANYLEANQIIASSFSLSIHQEIKIENKQVEELLQMIKNNAVFDERTKLVLSSVESFSQIEDIIIQNGSAESTTETRSLEWLEENGICVDHLYVKESTIRQAGRGAFARRFIPKGSVIISAPLLCTWGRHMFDMNAPYLPEGINKKHLKLNYQLAHKDSSVFFFPINTAIAINHQSAKSKSGNSPNAEMRWSISDKKSLYYQQRTLEDLKKEHYGTMSMDFVATRDIYPEEEVFIDYGDEWEHAWNEHVKNFVSPCPLSSMSEKDSGETNEDSCLTSKFVESMNDDKFNPNFHNWSEKHFTVCASYSIERSENQIIILADKSLTDISIDRLESELSEAELSSSSDTVISFSFRDIEYDHEGFSLVHRGREWYPCYIVNAQREDNIFDVVVFTAEEGATESLVGSSSVLRRVRTLSPHEIKFIHKPYTSDMFWKGAFRHEIRIPDNIFPQLWKDLL